MARSSILLKSAAKAENQSRSVAVVGAVSHFRRIWQHDEGTLCRHFWARWCTNYYVNINLLIEFQAPQTEAIKMRVDETLREKDKEILTNTYADRAAGPSLARPHTGDQGSGRRAGQKKF